MDLLRIIELLLFHCIKVGRFFGVAVRIHWSFWILPLAIGIASLRQGPMNAAIMVGIVLLFYVCVVLHEYGHILMARYFGVRTRDIIVTPLGGIARMERMPDRPGEEILIAIAGPSVNVVIATVLGVLLLLIGRGPSAALVAQSIVGSWTDVMLLLMFGNIGMAMFNLLPAFPSDGGRIVRAFLAMFIDRLPATQVAVGLGTVVAACLALFGLFNGAFQLPLIAILFAFIGQMELRMVRRQEEMKGRVWTESREVAPNHAAMLTAPELDFSGYSWDARLAAWVEWRHGIAVRVCRTRGW